MLAVLAGRMPLKLFGDCGILVLPLLPCSADLFAMLIIIPAFLALGWVHKWRMG